MTASAADTNLNVSKSRPDEGRPLLAHLKQARDRNSSLNPAQLRGLYTSTDGALDQVAFPASLTAATLTRAQRQQGLEPALPDSMYRYVSSTIENADSVGIWERPETVDHNVWKDGIRGLQTVLVDLDGISPGASVTEIDGKPHFWLVGPYLTSSGRESCSVFCKSGENGNTVIEAAALHPLWLTFLTNINENPCIVSAWNMEEPEEGSSTLR